MPTGPAPPPSWFQDIPAILKQTFKEFNQDRVLRMSAALAYYSIFSLAPLLVIAVAIAGAVLGDEAVRGQLDEHLRSSVGSSGALAVQEMVANASKPGATAWASIGSLLMLLVGAGGVFGQLKEALNTAWGVEEKPGRGIMGMIKDRFFSFSMVLGTGFLLLVSMLLTASLQGLGKFTAGFVGLPPGVWAVIHSIVSLLVIAGMFAAIFKVLPDVQIGWRDVRVGALVTALLFVAGKSAMGWYLGREATASAYGTAGSLALVLLWVYYSSVILLLGAEFTQVWATRHGTEIIPDQNAEEVDPQAAARSADLG